LIIVMILL